MMFSVTSCSNRQRRAGRSWRGARVPADSRIILLRVVVNEVSQRATVVSITRRLAEVSALKRIGTPEDVADAILFFASDYSRHVTGQMILVDGGVAMP